MRLPPDTKPKSNRPVYTPLEVSGRVRPKESAAPPGPVVVPGSFLWAVQALLPQHWRELYEESQLSTKLLKRDKAWWDTPLGGKKPSWVVNMAAAWVDTKRGDKFWRTIHDDLRARGL